MSLPLKLRPVVNKRTKQIIISLPKKKLPKKLVDDIVHVKKLDFLLEGWD